MMSKYLEMGPIVKVKRLKDVIVTSAEFQQHMDIIGRVKHKNCAAVVAYYFSKGEVLMVYDYYNEGSLFALLHGNVAARDPLSWNTRLKIALTTAKGVSHIHKLHASKLVHGNVRSSNIVLDGSNCAIISDTALSKVMKPIKYWPLKHQSYIAPEVKDTSYMSQAADVYSFGVVLLELLTRKLARETWNDDGLFSLVQWVQNHVRAGTCFEVFDEELLGYDKEVMVEALQLAMSCVESIPEQRPKMLPNESCRRLVGFVTKNLTSMVLRI